MQVKQIGMELSEIENELYDRQIRLWGLESQKRLCSAKVLISGLSGFGAEVTKNLILSGVHSVLLHDEKLVSEEDFCSQFLVSRESVGVNRATASLERAKRLNPMVEISSNTEALEKLGADFLTKFDIVVISDAKKSELIRIDSICRANKIYFFCGDVWGSFGYCFADLQDHTYNEEIVKHKVAKATANKQATMELLATTVKKSLNSSSLQDVFDFNYSSQSYSSRIKRVGPSLIAFHILHTFRENFNRDPSYKTRDQDLASIEKIRNDLNAENVPMSWMSNVISQVSAASAIVGGVLAQEVIKVISQKDSPLNNVFFFDPENCTGFIEKISANEQAS